MQTVRKDLDILFERNLKWRLLKRAFTSAEGLKVLINSFRYYDLANTGKINKDKWVDSLIANGLIIGISKDELAKLFDKYKEENTELIDYKKFAFDLFFKYKNKVSLNKVNQNNNNNYNNVYQQTESMINPKRYNNNSFLDIKETSPVSRSQQLPNINNYSLGYSTPLINRQLNNNYQNIRYNYANRNLNNNSENNMPIINYTCLNVNNVKNSLSYFKSKINRNNGLNYYRLILDLKSKSSPEDKILKNYLPIALQNIGVFYTQNELQNFFSALGCSEITLNTFSLSKMIELIKDEMNDYRKNIIINIFNNLCQLDNNNNALSLNILKENFKPEMHPEVLNNRRTKNDIYQQFCESLDIYAKLNNITNTINLEQFIDFYSGISSSIFDDTYFSYITNNVWGLSQENKNENNENNIVSTIQKSPSSPKISYNNLDIDKFNLNYNERNNLNDNNYNRNSSIKDRINNNSNAKINLPLFYYNRNNGLNNNNNLSKSTNFTENIDLNKINNSVLTPNNKARNDNILEINEQNYLNEVNNKRKSPYKNNINSNLMNQDLNLISSKKSIDISSIISKMKEIFILRGIKSIFSFQRMLLVYDINHTGQITLNHLQSIIQAYNYNFSSSELNNLFTKFDPDNTGFIQYNYLLNEIVGNMDMTRFRLIKKLYDALPKNQNGNINIDVFKNSFCPTKHYDVINGNKSNDEIYGEFLECFEIFREYNNNLKGGISKNELNYEEFCDFFGEISFGITNDFNFSNLVQNCWKIENEYY